MDCNLLSVSKAIEQVTGQRINPTTAWRWREKGVRGVKLQVVHFGGRVMTTTDFVQKFLDACSSDSARHAFEPSTQKPSSRAEKASARLKKVLGK